MAGAVIIPPSPTRHLDSFLKETTVIRTSIAAAVLLILPAAVSPSLADQNGNPVPVTATHAQQPDRASNRLLMVNGNSGRVIYDDGHEDLFCVTRRYLVGWTETGRRIYHRTMSCR
jgi:hypothetical protein